MNFVPLSMKGPSERVESFDDLETFADRSQPVVTMFSGGLDSSYLLFKLRSLGFDNIHAIAIDLGQPMDLSQLKDISARFGAKFHIIDGKQRFLEHGVKPAIRAHAKYHGNYPLSSSLSRPVIAELIVEYARSIRSRLLLHTANLSQNSLPRLNMGIVRAKFDGFFGSPYVRSVLSREDKAAELASCGLKFMTDRTLSGDENLWCREFESGPLDDPEQFDIPETAFVWTAKAPHPKDSQITLEFINGELTAVDQTHADHESVIAMLNQRIGAYGHGRYVGLEHILTGEKVLEVREAPAAMILMDALRHLETATLDTDAINVKQNLEQLWVREAIDGRWGSRVHIMAYEGICAALEGVSGTVSYKLSHNHILPFSIVADKPRYIRDRDGWELQKSKCRQISQEIEFIY